MSSLYASELHKFIESYFTTVGVRIVHTEDDFFIAEFPDGKREFFTYIPRIASENKEVRLLAKGSRYLKAIIEECNKKATFTQVRVDYSEESIRSTLQTKKCCDCCSFSTVCENPGECCDFCHYYKSCNTRIINAGLCRTGSLKCSVPVQLICFIFMVELSNDYSLSQKIEKTLTVLIDLNTGKVYDDILAKDFVHLEMSAPQAKMELNAEQYAGYLQTAYHKAEDIIKEHLEVFKKEIEKPLAGKITSIISKFEEEYVENYTRTSLAQLEDIQSNALKLCEREVKGYTINTGYHLKNVVLMETRMDTLELVFRNHHTGKEAVLEAELFMSKLDIRCSLCGTEIDTGFLCDTGHILCKNCCETCFSCGSVICGMCDSESHICSTCGEVICADCVIRCASCGAVVCPSHAYRCTTCGEAFCIDCYEICTVCGTHICGQHQSICSSCGESACSSHIHTCSVCGHQFCSNDIHACALCGALSCEEHTSLSSYSGKPVCHAHTSRCSICEDIFASDEVEKCSACGDLLCPSHVKECHRCKKLFCSKHINHCRSCGMEFCECTDFVKCKLCGEEYCPDCINAKGYCKACGEMEGIGRDSVYVTSAMAQQASLEEYNKFYIGSSKEIKVLLAKGLFKSQIVILNNNLEILGSRELRLIENLTLIGRIKLR